MDRGRVCESLDAIDARDRCRKALQYHHLPFDRIAYLKKEPSLQLYDRLSGGVELNFEFNEALGRVALAAYKRLSANEVVWDRLKVALRDYKEVSNNLVVANF